MSNAGDSSADMAVTVAINTWQQQITRAGKLFGGRTGEQLQHEVAPGRHRLVYLWGHLTAVHDLMIPLLRLGDRLHPELDAVFLTAPDKTVAEIPSAGDLGQYWNEVNAKLEKGIASLSTLDWFERHASVTEEDFAKEPHRNRFAILLGRTGHLANHIGQASLASK